MARDFIQISLNILQNLYQNSEEKMIASIDKQVEEVNINGEFKPILFQDTQTVLVHSNSPRYGNGSLIRDFINDQDLEPELKNKLVELGQYKQNQQQTYQSAVRAAMQYCTQIALKSLDTDYQLHLFLKLFPDYIWQDGELLKKLPTEEQENWLELKKPDNQSPNIIDPAHNYRNSVMNFTDIYYGLDFLDNF